MTMVYDDYISSMILVDLWFWSMMVVFDLTSCDIFIYVNLVKYPSLTCCDKKMTWLQMYLIEELPMRYDVNLFQFILNLMEVMCLE